ncbi:MAG: ATP-dependent RecD-like DNA helicase [Paludibacteraceae bacterium]
MNSNIEKQNLPYDPQNEPQRKAYELIANTNTSFFLTGRAGTGKTTFLRKIREAVDKNFVVVAPTGIAAIIAGGETIHSFFGMPLEILTSHSKFNINETKQTILRCVDTIIVDEASMVRCDMVDAMDDILRIIMKNNLPFGGKQMIFSGDIFQLDPVVKRNSTEMDMLRDLYNTDMPYFYKANVFRRSELVSIEFQKVYRQEDNTFLNMLTNIRNGEVDWQEINMLNRRVEQRPEEGKLIITLASLNKTANEINQQHLDAIDSEAITYEGTFDGEFKSTDLPVPQHLTLKIGAQVMLCRNDPAHRWVNGTLATVTKLNEQSVTIKTNEEEYEVNPVQWEQPKYMYDKVTKKLEKTIIGSYTQLPLRLAWAITIHKSQGMTFEQMILDLSQGVFMPGQLYVALSRVKSLNGLFLTSPIKASYIRPKEQANRFATSFNDERAIACRLKVGEAVYPFIRREDYDGAVRAYYEQIITALDNQEMDFVQTMVDNMLSLMVDDACLTDEEWRIIKHIVGNNDSLNSMYIRSLAFYRAGHFHDADAANVQLVEHHQNNFDNKCYLLVARTNDAIGDPALGLYQRVIKNSDHYLPAYVALRRNMHTKGESVPFNNDEEGAEFFRDWNNYSLNHEEWCEKYTDKIKEKDFGLLRTALLKLAYEG